MASPSYLSFSTLHSKKNISITAIEDNCGALYANEALLGTIVVECQSIYNQSPYDKTFGASVPKIT